MRLFLSMATTGLVSHARPTYLHKEHVVDYALLGGCVPAHP